MNCIHLMTYFLVNFFFFLVKYVDVRSKDAQYIWQVSIGK